jgi:hypothetical protein
VQTEETQALVRRFYDAYARGDRAATQAMIDDDIDWVSYGPADFIPTKGARRGKAAVLEVIHSVDDRYELKGQEMEIGIVEGDRAATVMKVAFMQRATGRTLSFRSAQMLRFRNGKLVEFREFSDTFDLLQQFLGRRIKP